MNIYTNINKREQDFEVIMDGKETVSITRQGDKVHLHFRAHTCTFRLSMYENQFGDFFRFPPGVAAAMESCSEPSKPSNNTAELKKLAAFNPDEAKTDRMNLCDLCDGIGPDKHIGVFNVHTDCYEEFQKESREMEEQLH